MEKRNIFKGFSYDKIQEIVNSNPSLRGYVQGYLSEEILAESLRSHPSISSVTKICDHNEMKGDLLVVYEGITITIECKSILTNTVTHDVLNDTWQAKVLIKNTDKRTLILDGIGEISTSSAIRGQYDILAISCFAVTGSYDFLFLENRFIPSKNSETPELLKTSFIINPQTSPCLTEDVLQILKSVKLRKLKDSAKIES